MRCMCSVTTFFLSVLVILGISAPAWGGADEYLIIAGKSAGLIELGKPIPQKVMKSLGKPTTFTAPSPGAEGKDTGNYFWQGNLNVKINDGNGDYNVFQILVIGPRYHTARDIRVGSALNAVKRAYPMGKRVEAMDCDLGWEVSGMTFYINGGKVTSIGIEPRALGTH